jgi:hypothetical protein
MVAGALAAGQVELQLHQVEPGQHLGQTMLHLQARIDLEEEERPAVGGEQKLDGRDAGIAGGLGQADRGVAQRLVEDGSELRRRRFLDHLLVAALHAAVAQSERAAGAVLVGGDLDLDVAGPRHEGFEEDGRIAEGLRRLGAGARERAGDVVPAFDQADAAAAAGRGGLDEQRQAEPARRGLDRRVGHRGIAPRCHRHGARLRQPLGADLVAQRAHGAAAGADEHQAALLELLDEGGILGEEAQPGQTLSACVARRAASTRARSR